MVLLCVRKVCYPELGWEHCPVIEPRLRCSPYTTPAALGVEEPPPPSPLSSARVPPPPMPPCRSSLVARPCRRCRRRRRRRRHRRRRRQRLASPFSSSTLQPPPLLRSAWLPPAHRHRCARVGARARARARSESIRAARAQALRGRRQHVAAVVGAPARLRALARVGAREPVASTPTAQAPEGGDDA